MPSCHRIVLIVAVLLLSVALTACASSRDDAPAAADVAEERSDELTDQVTPEPSPSPSPSPERDADPEPPEASPSGRDEGRIPYWHRWWDNTDFENHTVPLSEISSGGVPADGIPPIDEPVFISYDEADEWLNDREPVISINIDGEARAYPLQIMTWHEIVNDTFGDRAVGVTFCPLCNAAVAFDREVGDHGVMRFGVSGLLRFSDLIMWDDKTESFWQQMTGEAIVGELAGERLTLLPSVIVSYEEFKATYPDTGVVLSRETGHSRPYGNNPYVGYDDIDSSPFLFQGERDDRFPPMERVLTLEINDEPMAYAFSLLEEHPVVHDVVGDVEVVVFWSPGATSALDQTSIAESREVGSANAFKPELDGERLTFVYEDGEIRDEQTGSIWNVLGYAISGELEGERLEEHVNGAHFWFAWAAFKPDTGIWRP
jgi:hypothetical protein